MLSPERLCLALIRSAVAAGCGGRQSWRAGAFLIEDNRCVGFEVKDRLSRKRLQLRAAMTINAAGPGLTIMSATDKMLAGQKIGALQRHPYRDPQFNARRGAGHAA